MTQDTKKTLKEMTPAETMRFYLELKRVGDRKKWRKQQNIDPRQIDLETYIAKTERNK